MALYYVIVRDKCETDVNFSIMATIHDRLCETLSNMVNF